MGRQLGRVQRKGNRGEKERGTRSAGNSVQEAFELKRGIFISDLTLGLNQIQIWFKFT
jgi:hypothetical protein